MISLICRFFCLGFFVCGYTSYSQSDSVVGCLDNELDSIIVTWLPMNTVFPMNARPSDVRNANYAKKKLSDIEVDSIREILRVEEFAYSDKSSINVVVVIDMYVDSQIICTYSMSKFSQVMCDNKLARSPRLFFYLKGLIW